MTNYLLTDEGTFVSDQELTEHIEECEQPYSESGIRLCSICSSFDI